jgi:hypothetical protein
MGVGGGVVEFEAGGCMTLKELVKAIRKSIADTEREVGRINRILYAKELEEANAEVDPHERLRKLCQLRDKTYRHNDY